MEGAVRSLVVGLGNPGEKYERTRHNVGFRIAERFASEHGFPRFRGERGAHATRGALAGEGVVVLKPQNYMNRSGGVVARWLAELGLGAESLLVCYDEVALPLGRLRLRAQGSAAGHNGVQSVIDALGTEAFPRLRFGIRPETEFDDQVEFVLSPFTRRELALVELELPRAAEAVACFCREDIARAMNRFNAASPSSPSES